MASEQTEQVPQFERVTDAERILTLLKSLQSGKVPLTVTIPGFPDKHASRVLMVNADDRYLLLDKFNTDAGHDQLLSAGSLRASGEYRGSRMDFSTTLREVIEDKKGLAYLIDFPVTFNYQQRRAEYRVDASDENIPASLTLDDDVELKGRIADISPSGISFFVSRQNETLFNTVGNTCQCQLQLPGDITLSMTIELRNITVRDDDRVKVGFKILTLDRAQISSLREFVMAMQRSQLQKGLRI